jgi:hypothetical protein
VYQNDYSYLGCGLSIPALGQKLLMQSNHLITDTKLRRMVQLLR